MSDASRPDRIQEFISSALSTTAQPERIEILLYVDDDDSEHQAYEKVISQLVKEHGNSSISLTIGPSISVPRAANKLAELTTADIFMTTNDN